MKKVNFLLIFLVFLIQFSFLPIFFKNFEVPNLVLIGVAIIGFKKDFWENLGWFVLAGLIFEFFGASVFGIYLSIFILIGLVTWVLRNVFLNKEFDLLIEFLFWFLVKISWDLIFRLEIFLLELFGQKGVAQDFHSFISWTYFKNLIIFVVAGMFLSWAWKKFIRKLGG